MKNIIKKCENTENKLNTKIYSINGKSEKLSLTVKNNQNTVTFATSRAHSEHLMQNDSTRSSFLINIDILVTFNKAPALLTVTWCEKISLTDIRSR